MVMKYRPEIDGLRAVAVVPVILFHGEFSGFGGGFVGVDVFFVISGYLITTLILEDLQQDRFSPLMFWERRARRILPPLFVMIAACLPFAWSIMLPHELKDFGQSLLAVSLFAANILFWKENNYFAGPADEKPLLHTWSLAVEEQFYLLFPILMLLLWRRQSFALWIGVLMIVSFGLSDWGARSTPGAAFFLLPFRAWELLAGSLCAIYLRGRVRSAHDGLACIGLVLIGLSVVTLTGADIFPGRAALPPVVGTCLVIVFAQFGGRVATALSWKPFVGLGLISYSLYLWHQPVFAFLRLENFGTLTPTAALLALPAVLMLAWLSWYWIEGPWRRRNLFGRKVVFTSAGAVLVLTATIGTALHVGNGVPERLPHSARFAGLDAVMPCHNADNANLKSGPVFCRLGAVDAPLRMVLLGDSHAAHLAGALDLAGRDAGFAVAAVTASWCAPLIGISTNVPGRGAGCDALMSDAFAALDAAPDIDTVILAAQWGNFVTGGRWGTVPIVYNSSGSENSSLEGNAAVFHDAITQTANRLSAAGKSAILVGPVPSYHAHVPDTLKRQLWWSGENSLPPAVEIPSADQRAQSGVIWRMFDQEPEVFATRADPADVFCAADICAYQDAEGHPYYRDANHLSPLGAQLVVAEILKVMPD